MWISNHWLIFPFHRRTSKVTWLACSVPERTGFPKESPRTRLQWHLLRFGNVNVKYCGSSMVLSPSTSKADAWADAWMEHHMPDRKCRNQVEPSFWLETWNMSLPTKTELSEAQRPRVHREDVNFWQPSSEKFTHIDLIWVKKYLGDWRLGCHPFLSENTSNTPLLHSTIYAHR